MAKPKNKAAELLKVLRETSPSQPTHSDPPSQQEEEKPVVRPQNKAETATPPPRRGKAVQFWMHQADEKLIREFAASLAPHRKRINDSLMIKMALRVAKKRPAAELLVAYDEAIKNDGRGGAKKSK